MIYNRIIAFLCVITSVLVSMESGMAQANIATSATVTCQTTSSSGCWNLQNINDGDRGTCGTQQSFVWSASPPALTDYIQWEWSTIQRMEKVEVFHGQTSGRFLAGCKLQYWDGATFRTIGSFTLSQANCENSMTFLPVATTKLRLTEMIPGTGQNSNLNYREIEIIEAPLFYNDAGITNFPNPGIPVCQTLSDSIELEITNFGVANLDSVWVGLRVNDTTLAPQKVITGGTVQNATARAVVKFFRNFAIGDTITAWSFEPNGVLDTNYTNDTITFILIDGLSGDYTVGPGMDFATLDSAITDLNKRGVCTPVTFTLYDTAHVWRGTIDKYFGASSARLVRFVSASGDPSRCSISFASTGSNSNYVLNLNRAQHLQFDSLSIVNTSTGSYSGGIRFLGGVSNITFKYCVIESSHTGSSSNALGVYSMGTSLDESVTFDNCTFKGGAKAIAMEGSAINAVKGVSVLNSVFENQSIGSLDFKAISSVDIKGNIFSSTSTLSGSTAMAISNANDALNVSSNEIISTSQYPNNALVILGSNGRLNNPILIANNIFKLADTNSANQFTGIFLDTVGFAHIVYNTVVIEGTDADNVCLKIDNSGGNQVYNNIFANMGNGKALNYKGLGSVLVSNHNNIYSTGSVLGTNGSSDEVDLTGWQTGSGFDLNSVSDDPGFNSRTDLHLCGATSDNIGIPVSGVQLDYDGVFRDPAHPDPGAYEFASPTKFAVGNSFNICNGDTFSVKPPVSVNDILIWNSTDTSFTFTTVLAGTYTAENISQCGVGRDTFDVVINPLVTLPADTNICYGDTLTLVNNIGGQTLWNDGAQALSKNVHTAGRYSVEVIDAYGCYSTDTIYITRSLAAMLPGDTTICEGVVLELNPGTGAGTYAWSNGSSAPVLFVDSSFNYTLNYTDILGCTSTANTVVSVKRKPSQGFTSRQSQSNMEFFANDTSAASYHWSFGDGKSTTGTYRTVHIYPGNGSYKVTLTISNECGTTVSDSSMEIGTIGFAETAINNLIIYPNPTSGKVTISSNSPVVGIRIMDLLGSEIAVPYINGIEDSEIDLSQVSVGTYIIHIFFENGSTTAKSLYKIK